MGGQEFQVFKHFGGPRTTGCPHGGFWEVQGAEPPPTEGGSGGPVWNPYRRRQPATMAATAKPATRAKAANGGIGSQSTLTETTMATLAAMRRGPSTDGAPCFEVDD